VTQFWPPRCSGAQAEYETLREIVLSTGTTPDTLIAARLFRRGLAGLIAWPATEPVFVAEVLGGQRPPWTPHGDPRLGALAESFELVLSVQTPCNIRELMK
jgi:hypothetical protein